MSHDYHDALPGYDSRQLLHDGCGECERRGIGRLDRSSELDSSQFSSCEGPLLDALWSVQVQLERLGDRLDGVPTVVR